LLGEVRGNGDLTDTRRLIIVPHGALTYLPFAALWHEQSGRYLAEEYSLSFLPSAASLPALRSFEEARGTRDQPAYTVAAFAPLTRELPASRGEAETVRRTLGGELYLGRRATEDALRNALSTNRIVHVASHGVMNIRNPMFSRIEMAAGNALEIHEVLALTIRSPLIFLSGCETGLGRAWSTTFAQGEDYATLERAFLYSGARSVVATLWQVEDAGSVEFAKEFYDRLEDLGPADALVQAQRRMLKHPRYGHPYFWAAYRLSGGG
jgi:CHAT domain-containing protein